MTGTTLMLHPISNMIKPPGGFPSAGIPLEMQFEGNNRLTVTNVGGLRFTFTRKE